MRSPILDKASMYQLLEAGRLGNAFRAWRLAEDLISSGYSGLVGVRLVGRRGEVGLPYRHHLTVAEGIELAARWRVEWDREPVIHEASPDEHILWQGEATRLCWGWHVEYSRTKTHMRAAFAKERLVADGVRALVLLRETLSPGSFTDLEELLGLYPDHVVELTAYDICIGQIPGRSAVVWEVRKY